VTAPLGPSAEVRARILEAARRSPVAPRGEVAGRRIGAVVLGFVITAVIGVRLGVNPGHRPWSYIAALEGAWLALAGLVTWAGVSRGRSMLGRPEGWKAAVILVTPLALVALWWPLTVAWPQTLERESGWFEVAQCLVGTALLGIGPLLAFAYVRRESEPVNPWLGGAALGAAAGAWGAAALVVICRHASVSHMLLGHVVPVVLFTVLGAAIAGPALALRARTR
jgi:hypothetical protein